MAHTKLQCAAKKLQHRPSMARRRTSKSVTCNSPVPKSSPTINIIRRCELLASLLDHVAKALWDFNGMNVKGDLAVDGAKNTRRCGQGSLKRPCGLPNMFFKGAPQRKPPADACGKPYLPIQNIQTSKNAETPRLAHTKLHCAAKKLLRRPNMARRAAVNRITCNSPVPKSSPTINIIRRCELLASLLDHVAKALWDFNGMNVKGVKGVFAVVGVKDIRECGLTSAKLPRGLPILLFTGASQRKLPV